MIIQLKVVATFAALFALRTLPKYEIMTIAFNNTEIAATAVYMSVGHSLLSFAQRLRFTVVPVGCFTSLKMFFVLSNLCRVKATGMRDPILSMVATVREATLSMRMRCLSR